MTHKQPVIYSLTADEAKEILLVCLFSRLLQICFCAAFVSLYFIFTMLKVNYITQGGSCFFCLVGWFFFKLFL